jgi:peptide deformylase
MYADSGIGLAAPQVGLSEAMIIVDIGAGLYKLINPKIVKRSGWQALEEGCLSVPGVCIKVRRARKVVVKALDETGKPQSIEAEDLLACVLQHEIDHLKGKLIVDYASLFKRLRIKRRLGELKKRVEDEKLSESETKSCQLQL